MSRVSQSVLARLSSSAVTLPMAAALLFVIAAPAAPAQSAKTLYKRGADAETREDWDTALEDYRQALAKDPKDLRTRAHYENMRFQSGVFHVDRGRVLRQNGDLQGAINEFTRATQIDPGNQAAHQELEITKRQLAAQSAAPTPGVNQLAGQDVTSRALSQVAGPIELRPVSNVPITLHMVEDVKNIYQAIGKLAGLNVIFDPDYTSKRIPVDLTNVSLADALRIVGALGGTFYKPVTQNTIFVAQNTRTKRTDLDELAVQTFYLTNASQQADANEILTALRNLMDPSMKITLVPSQNAIVLRATPDQLLLAQKLIADLDRARPEVVVDVAILQVNRDKVRNLGITLPQSMTITPQASPTSSSSSSSSSSSGTTTNTTSNFTLNTLANMNATNFAVSIPGATLNALLTDTNTRILQNPRIRATDGQRANLKIGQKIPIATGSYNAGVSTGVASIGVQTQFTYLDVGVLIDITPTVHFDREITLKAKMEVSSQQGSVTISNVTQPIIGQNTVEQVIELKEGEPSILAGLVTKGDLRDVNGTPGLGEIPFFKYFFASNKKEIQENEIIFLLIPHIVRESVLTRANIRAIDTGTGQSIELRQDATINNLDMPVNPGRTAQVGQPTSAAAAATAAAAEFKKSVQPPTRSGYEAATTAAGAANAAASEMKQATQPADRSATPPPVTSPAPQPQTGSQPTQPGATQPDGAPISLNVAPPSGDQHVGGIFRVSVSAANARDLHAVPMEFTYNPKVIQFVTADAGDLLTIDGQAVSVVQRDEGNGTLTVSASRPPSASGVNGQGGIATLTFKAVAPGDSNLALVKAGALNSADASLPAVGSQSVVHVR